MALWDFLGGAADEGLNILRDKSARDQDKAAEIDREKRKAELEKNRITAIQYGESNGQLMAQPVNAAGEPVGQPRPANDVERQRYEQGEQERTLKIKATNADIAASEATTGFNKARTEAIPEEQRHARMQAESYRTSANAQAASAAANADFTRENTRAARAENDRLEEWLKGNPGQLPPKMDHRPVQPNKATVDAPEKVQEEILEIADQLDSDNALTDEQKNVLREYANDPDKLLQILRQFQREHEMGLNVESSSDNTMNSLDNLIRSGR